MLNRLTFAVLAFLFSLTLQAAPINALFHGNDPVAGNPRGSVTLVEFFDYQCSHCIDMAPVITSVIKANPQLRVVFKEWPIRGDVSNLAARAALAANKQGKYSSFSHALFANSDSLSEQKILDLAKNQGLNVAKLKKDMNDSSVKNQIAATFRLAQELKLPGTPALFVAKTNVKNEKDIIYIAGGVNQSELQTAIDNANK